jgi:hypothetical protein
MQAVADMVRVTHTPGAAIGDQVDADTTLMELLAQRTAIRRQVEDRAARRERGH